MDRRTITAMLLMMVIIFGWMALVKRFGPQPQAPQQSTSATAPAAAPAPAASQPVTPGTAPTTIPTLAPATQAGAGLRVAPTTGPAEPTTLGSDDQDSPFTLRLAVTPRGAAIESATLNRYFKTVQDKQHFQFQTPYPIDNPQLNSALAMRAVIINGAAVDLATALWQRHEQQDARSVTYTTQVTEAAGRPVLDIARTYTLSEQDKQKNGQSYLVQVSTQFTNRTDQPMAIKAIVNGPNTFPPENRNDLVYLAAGFNNDTAGPGNVLFKHYAVTSLTKDKPTYDLATDTKYPMLWAGLTSAYFNAIVRPQIESGSMGLAGAKAEVLDPEAEVPHHIALSLETTEAKLQPGASSNLALEVYLGPKLRTILDDDYFAMFPRGYDQTLVLTSGPCAWCTFTWLIDILVKLLGAFHFVLRDWGLAIIALVCLVRLILHPITKKSQVAMSKMSKMGPEMQRLKEKHKDNPQELQRAMAGFYKEQGITPVLGCLPMFLQMPIWIALWQSLQTTFELRHQPFLWNLTWIHDLSQPDQLIHIPLSQPVKIFWFSFSAISLNVLPILMGVASWFQQKMTPKPPSMTPEQEQQQKMMQWMVFLFPLILYSGPAGLNLYIVTSTVLGIFESRRIRKHIEEQEAAEKAGRILVDARQTRSGRKIAREERPEQPKKRGLAGWFAELQAKAEEMRRDQNRPKK